MAKSVEGRLRDACFIAFMRGKEEHADWMNDVLPMVDREIAAAIREDRAAMVSDEIAEQLPGWAMLQSRHLVEEHIRVYGMVPHPDKIKEAIAAALEAARKARAG